MIPRRLPRALAGVLVLFACAVPAAAQHVSFQPSASEPAVPEFTVNVHLDTEDETVQGLDVFFSYDPGIIRLDGIAAGHWFTGDSLAYYFWDDPGPSPGTGHFTSAKLGMGRDYDGTVAVLNFTALSAGISPLVFADSCSVRDDANQDLPTTFSTGDYVRIDAAIAAEPSTLSRLKALWR